MAVIWTPESAHGKELRKWEYGPPSAGYRGLKDDLVTVWPRMLYKAGRSDGGPVVIVGREIARTPDELARLTDQGFVDGGQQVAIDAFHARDLEIAKLAANRHHAERGMSDPARREIAAHEAESDDHLPEIPATPIRKRGRPAKLVSAE